MGDYELKIRLKDEDREMLTNVWLALMLIARIFFVLGSLTLIAALRLPSVTSFIAEIWPVVNLNYLYGFLIIVSAFLCVEIFLLWALLHSKLWAFKGLLVTTVFSFGFSIYVMALLGSSLGDAFTGSLTNMLGVFVLYLLLRKKLQR